MTDFEIPAVAETKKIKAADGRDLAYIEFGDPRAPLLIHNHGSPSSRLEGRLLAPFAIRHGIRLVCVDRPGFGQSSPQSPLSYQSWASDLTAIADALGYQRFGVSGWSGGGPSAFAAAFYIDPTRLQHVTDIAGAHYGAFGANWAAQYLSKVDALGGSLALHHPIAFHLMYSSLELDAVHFRNSYWKSLTKVLGDQDRTFLAQDGVKDAFLDASAECFAQGVRGLEADAAMSYRPWEFDITTIERPVHIWQGTDDHFVPAKINEVVAQRVPGAVLHSVEGADHFVALTHGDSIFALAAEEPGAGADGPGAR